MAFFAVLVVVEAADETLAQDGVITGMAEQLYVSCPWPVHPSNTDGLNDPAVPMAVDPEFDALDCFDQHPQK